MCNAKHGKIKSLRLISPQVTMTRINKLPSIQIHLITDILAIALSLPHSWSAPGLSWSVSCCTVQLYPESAGSACAPQYHLLVSFLLMLPVQFVSSGKISPFLSEFYPVDVSFIEFRYVHYRTFLVGLHRPTFSSEAA